MQSNAIPSPPLLLSRPPPPLPPLHPPICPGGGWRGRPSSRTKGWTELPRAQGCWDTVLGSCQRASSISSSLPPVIPEDLEGDLHHGRSPCRAPRSPVLLFQGVSFFPLPADFVCTGTKPINCPTHNTLTPGHTCVQRVGMLKILFSFFLIAPWWKQPLKASSRNQIGPPPPLHLRLPRLHWGGGENRLESNPSSAASCVTSGRILRLSEPVFPCPRGARDSMCLTDWLQRWATVRGEGPVVEHLALHVDNAHHKLGHTAALIMGNSRISPPHL